MHADGDGSYNRTYADTCVQLTHAETGENAPRSPHTTERVASEDSTMS